MALATTLTTDSKLIMSDATEEEEEYSIVGSQEADPMNFCISDDSPFGRAMIGHQVGDVVDVEAPVGVLHFRIIAVEK